MAIDVDTEMILEGDHDDDVPIEEVMGLVDERRRTNRKTPCASTVIIQKLMTQNPVQCGTIANRVGAQTSLLRSQTCGPCKWTTHREAGSGKETHEPVNQQKEASQVSGGSDTKMAEEKEQPWTAERGEYARKDRSTIGKGIEDDIAPLSQVEMIIHQWTVST